MGSSPSAPAALPDPAIAAERARREAIAIGHLEARRTTRSGSASTIRSQRTATGQPIARPTEVIAQHSLENTRVSRVEKDVSVLEKSRRAEERRAAERVDTTDGEGNVDLNKARTSEKVIRALNQQIKERQGSITPADKVVHEGIKKDTAIAGFINRARKRVGVSKTQGAR